MLCYVAMLRFVPSFVLRLRWRGEAYCHGCLLWYGSSL